MYLRSLTNALKIHIGLNVFILFPLETFVDSKVLDSRNSKSIPITMLKPVTQAKVTHTCFSSGIKQWINYDSSCKGKLDILCAFKDFC